MDSTSPVIVVISSATEDRLSLDEILDGLPWEVVQFATFQEAVDRLGRACVVLCDAELPDAGWRDVIRAVEPVPDPPMVIVTARLADDRLWAEVLNEGGHDVLAKPFRVGEVLQSVTSSLRWRDNHRRKNQVLKLRAV